MDLDVFAYLNYRQFLRDYYEGKRAERRGFSYRSFSRRAGVASPNHLKRVIDGDRNLSDQAVEAYSKAIDLSGERASYFAALVRFNQSKTREDRESAYERIRSFRGYREAHIIDARYADYHAQWYIPAIREMALRSDFRAEPAWIARRMVPRIQIAEARRALEILFGLGFLVKNEEGGVSQADAVVSTGEQTRSLHIARYHEAMLDKAKRAIVEVPADARQITALTFCVGPRGFERVSERIQRFRNELIALLAEEQEGEQVLHLGMQLIPLTTRAGEGEKS